MKEAFYAEASTPAYLLEVGQRQRIFFASLYFLKAKLIGISVKNGSNLQKLSAF
jgi:hypothetical protein